MFKHIEPSKTNKKTAIVSYGTRITLTSNHVRSVDLYYMREYLLNVLHREVVDFVCKPIKGDLELDYYKDIETTDLNDYDEVYIYNCMWNAFGGVFKYCGLRTIEKLYDFKGDIIYMLVESEFAPIDYSLYLKYKNRHTKDYIWNCDNRKLGGKYPMDKAMIDDWHEKVFKRMKIAFAGIDYEHYANLWDKGLAKKRVDDIVREYQTINHDAEWFNFWLFEYYAVNERLDLKLQNYKKIDNPYTLVYFGNNRPDNRHKILKEYYNMPSEKKLWIGYDPNIENTDVLDYVNHDDLFKIIGEQCLATLVLVDERHSNNLRTPRFFECMMLDVAAFIYIGYDQEKKYVKNEFLKDFIYVSSAEEFQEKVLKIKQDPELYKKVIELERQEIFDQFGYMKK